MKSDSIANLKSQMLKGILEYCVMQILHKEENYAPEILKQLNESGLEVSEASIYTLLNRLRKEGKVSYKWEESPYGPPRKYYSLTSLGEETLKVFSKIWSDMLSSIGKFT